MINKNVLNVLVSIVFVLGHLLNYSNKGYVLFLFLFFCVSYLINKNLILVLWHIFLTILPFQRGRYFLTFVVEKEFWKGKYPINIEYLFKFSDFIILTLILLFMGMKRRQPNLSLFKIKSHVEIIFLFFFLICAAFSAFNATYSSFAFYQLMVFLAMVCLSFLTAFIRSYKPERNLVISIFLTHIFILSVLTCLQFKKGSQLGIELEQVSDQSPAGSFQFEAEFRFRPGGYFFDPNAAATWLIMSFPIWIYLLEKNENSIIKNIVYLTGSLLSLFALILTGSRFVWIISLLLFLFYFTQEDYRRLAKRLAKRYKKLIYVIGLGLLFAVPIIFVRLSNFSKTFSEGGGIDYRFAHYTLALEYIKNSPLGIGLGMFRYEILGNFLPEQFADDPTSPHNLFMEVAVGSGILGLFFFGMFIYLNFRRQLLFWLKTRRPFSLAILLSCVCYITVSQAYPYLLRSPLAEVFWMMIGISWLDNSKKLETQT